MGFFKRNGKSLLSVAFGIFILLQSIAIHYRMTHAMEMTDADGNDTLVSHEINQLEKLWHKADVTDLVTLEKMANHKELEQARIHLNQFEIDIQKAEERVRGVAGKRDEFLQKVHAYYRHSASALVDIVDFLLAHKEKYSVIENEISFESESDAARFRELIEPLSYLQREKVALDTFILNHNREVEKKLLVR